MSRVGISAAAGRYIHVGIASCNTAMATVAVTPTVMLVTPTVTELTSAPSITLKCSYDT